MVVYFYFVVIPGFYSQFLLGSNSVLLDSARFLLGSYYNMYETLMVLCSFFLLNQQLKKKQIKKRNNTKQKNPYYKNIIIELLNKKDKEKIEKHICS